MLLLGLTGNIACGKSTVARLLAARGAIVVDADALVHELYADQAFAAQVAALFDAPVLADDGTVERGLLAKIVFEDASALRKLESLVHPAVAELRDARLRSANALVPRPPAAVLEAVKLIEAGQGAICDAIWCVICSPEVQLRRLMANRGLSEAEARARLVHQPSLEAKIARLQDRALTFVENDGSPQQLEARVDQLWNQFLQLKREN